MIELTKLESLAFCLETMDEFADLYQEMLGQAAAAHDKETIKRMRVILHKQVAFAALEWVKARKEEQHGIEEIIQ